MKRLVSSLTTFAFLCQQIWSPAWANLAPFPIAEVATSTPHTFQLNLPPDLGTIDALVPGSGPTIIHIQDAHGNFEAQKNIQKMLHHINNEYGVDLLFLEGAHTKLKPDLLRFFPSRMELTMAIAESLTKRAIVKGPELFLLEAQDVEGYGIEDVENYRKNLRAFREVILQREKTQGFLNKINMQIERLTSPYLNKELRDFLRRLDAYEETLIPFKNWLDELKQKANDSLELDLTNAYHQVEWPMLLRIFALQAIEEKINMGAFRTEQRVFLDILKEQLTSDVYSQIETLLKAPLSQHNLPDPETGLLFERMASELPEDFDYSAFQNTNLFIGHLILQSELKAADLVKEMDSLTDKIIKKLVQSEKEKEIVELLNQHRLLKRLFALELTPEGYESIEELMYTQDFLPSLMIEQFEVLNDAGRVKTASFKQIEDINNLFHKALEFYRGTHERDLSMLENIEKLLRDTGKQKAFVITGGFHSGPFQRYFESKDYNYALITPTISDISKDRDLYLDAILQKSDVAPAKSSTLMVHSRLQVFQDRLNSDNDLDFDAEVTAFFRSTIEGLGELGLRQAIEPGIIRVTPVRERRGYYRVEYLNEELFGEPVTITSQVKLGRRVIERVETFLLPSDDGETIIQTTAQAETSAAVDVASTVISYDGKTPPFADEPVSLAASETRAGPDESEDLEREYDGLLDLDDLDLGVTGENLEGARDLDEQIKNLEAQEAGLLQRKGDDTESSEPFEATLVEGRLKLIQSRLEALRARRSAMSETRTDGEEFDAADLEHLKRIEQINREIRTLEEEEGFLAPRAYTGQPEVVLGGTPNPYSAREQAQVQLAEVQRKIRILKRERESLRGMSSQSETRMNRRDFLKGSAAALAAAVADPFRLLRAQESGEEINWEKEFLAARVDKTSMMLFVEAYIRKVHNHRSRTGQFLSDFSGWYVQKGNPGAESGLTGRENPWQDFENEMKDFSKWAGWKRGGLVEEIPEGAELYLPQRGDDIDWRSEFFKAREDKTSMMMFVESYLRGVKKHRSRTGQFLRDFSGWYVKKGNPGAEAGLKVGRQGPYMDFENEMNDSSKWNGWVRGGLIEPLDGQAALTVDPRILETQGLLNFVSDVSIEAQDDVKARAVRVTHPDTDSVALWVQYDLDPNEAAKFSIKAPLRDDLDITDFDTMVIEIADAEDAQRPILFEGDVRLSPIDFGVQLTTRSTRDAQGNPQDSGYNVVDAKATQGLKDGDKIAPGTILEIPFKYVVTDDKQHLGRAREIEFLFKHTTGNAYGSPVVGVNGTKANFLIKSIRLKKVAKSETRAKANSAAANTKIYPWTVEDAPEIYIGDNVQLIVHGLTSDRVDYEARTIGWTEERPDVFRRLSLEQGATRESEGGSGLIVTVHSIRPGTVEFQVTLPVSQSETRVQKGAQKIKGYEELWREIQKSNDEIFKRIDELRTGKSETRIDQEFKDRVMPLVSKATHDYVRSTATLYDEPLNLNWHPNNLNLIIVNIFATEASEVALGEVKGLWKYLNSRGLQYDMDIIEPKLDDFVAVYTVLLAEPGILPRKPADASALSETRDDEEGDTVVSSLRSDLTKDSFFGEEDRQEELFLPASRPPTEEELRNRTEMVGSGNVRTPYNLGRFLQMLQDLFKGLDRDSVYGVRLDPIDEISVFNETIAVKRGEDNNFAEFMESFNRAKIGRFYYEWRLDEKKLIISSSETRAYDPVAEKQEVDDVYAKALAFTNGATHISTDNLNVIRPGPGKPTLMVYLPVDGVSSEAEFQAKQLGSQFEDDGYQVVLGKPANTPPYFYTLLLSKSETRTPGIRIFEEPADEDGDVPEERERVSQQPSLALDVVKVLGIGTALVSVVIWAFSTFDPPGVPGYHENRRAFEALPDDQRIGIYLANIERYYRNPTASDHAFKKLQTGLSHIALEKEGAVALPFLERAIEDAVSSDHAEELGKIVTDIRKARAETRVKINKRAVAGTIVGVASVASLIVLLRMLEERAQIAEQPEVPQPGLEESPPTGADIDIEGIADEIFDQARLNTAGFENLAEFQMMDAEMAIDAGELEEAERNLTAASSYNQQALNIAPDTPELWFRSADISILYAQISQLKNDLEQEKVHLEKARASLEKALELGPDSEGYARLGNVMLALDVDIKEVIENNKKAVALDPTAASAHEALFLSFVDSAEMLEEAADYYRDFTTSKHPRNVLGWQYRGEISYALAFEANNRGDEVEKQKHLRDAVEFYEEALKIQAKVDILIPLAEAYVLLNDFDAAEPHYVKATELEPTRLATWIGLIRFYERTNQPEKAKAANEKAIEAMKDTPVQVQVPAQSQSETRRQVFDTSKRDQVNILIFGDSPILDAYHDQLIDSGYSPDRIESVLLEDLSVVEPTLNSVHLVLMPDNVNPTNFSEALKQLLDASPRFDAVPIDGAELPRDVDGTKIASLESLVVRSFPETFALPKAQSETRVTLNRRSALKVGGAAIVGTTLGIDWTLEAVGDVGVGREVANLTGKMTGRSRVVKAAKINDATQMINRTTQTLAGKFTEADSGGILAELDEVSLVGANGLSLWVPLDAQGTYTIQITNGNTQLAELVSIDASKPGTVSYQNGRLGKQLIVPLRLNAAAANQQANQLRIFGTKPEANRDNKFHVWNVQAVQAVRVDRQVQGPRYRLEGDALQQVVVDRVTGYTKKGVGLIHGSLPADHVQIDARDNYKIVSIADYTADSKFGAFYPTLIPIATGQVKSNRMTQQQARDAIKEGLLTLRALQPQMHGGLHGWIKWDENQGRYVSAEPWTPSLDPGQFAVALMGVIGVIGAMGDSSDAEERAIAIIAEDIIKNQRFDRMVDPATGKLWARWYPGQNRGEGHIHRAFTEDAIAYLFAILHGQIPITVRDGKIVDAGIWDELDAPVVTRRTSDGQEYDVPIGSIGSLHEWWAALYWDFSQSAWSDLTYDLVYHIQRLGSEAELSGEEVPPGAGATGYTTSGYAQVGYSDLLDQNAATTLQFEGTEVAMSYATSLLIPLDRPTGLKQAAALFNYKGKDPEGNEYKMMTDLGPAEGVKAEGIADVVTADSQYVSTASFLAPYTHAGVAHYMKKREVPGTGLTQYEVFHQLLDRTRKRIERNLGRPIKSVKGKKEPAHVTGKNFKIKGLVRGEQPDELQFAGNILSDKAFSSSNTVARVSNDGLFDIRYNIRPPAEYAFAGAVVREKNGENIFLDEYNEIEIEIPNNARGLYEIELKTEGHDTELAERIRFDAATVDSKPSTRRGWKRVKLKVFPHEREAKRYPLQVLGVSVPNPSANPSLREGSLQIRFIALRKETSTPSTPPGRGNRDQILKDTNILTRLHFQAHDGFQLTQDANTKHVTIDGSRGFAFAAETPRRDIKENPILWVKGTGEITLWLELKNRLDQKIIGQRPKFAGTDLFAAQIVIKPDSTKGGLAFIDLRKSLRGLDNNEMNVIAISDASGRRISWEGLGFMSVEQAKQFDVKVVEPRIAQHRALPAPWIAERQEFGIAQARILRPRTSNPFDSTESSAEMLAQVEGESFIASSETRLVAYRNTVVATLVKLAGDDTWSGQLKIPVILNEDYSEKGLLGHLERPSLEAADFSEESKAQIAESLASQMPKDSKFFVEYSAANSATDVPQHLSVRRITDDVTSGVEIIEQYDRTSIGDDDAAQSETRINRPAVDALLAQASDKVFEADYDALGQDIANLADLPDGEIPATARTIIPNLDQTRQLLSESIPASAIAIEDGIRLLQSAIELIEVKLAATAQSETRSKKDQIATLIAEQLTSGIDGITTEQVQQVAYGGTAENALEIQHVFRQNGYPIEQIDNQDVEDQEFVQLVLAQMVKVTERKRLVADIKRRVQKAIYDNQYRLGFTAPKSESYKEGEPFSREQLQSFQKEIEALISTAYGEITGDRDVSAYQSILDEVLEELVAQSETRAFEAALADHLMQTWNDGQLIHEVSTLVDEYGKPFNKSEADVLATMQRWAEERFLKKKPEDRFGLAFMREVNFETGQPSGRLVEWNHSHKIGSPHQGVHVYAETEGGLQIAIKTRRDYLPHRVDQPIESMQKMKRMLAQLRGDTKKFDLTATGHVELKPTPEEAAIMELTEELGLEDVGITLTVDRLIPVHDPLSGRPYFRKVGRKDFQGNPGYDDQNVYHSVSKEQHNREHIFLYKVIFTDAEVQAIAEGFKRRGATEEVESLALMDIHTIAEEVQRDVSRFASGVTAYFVDPRMRELFIPAMLAAASETREWKPIDNLLVVIPWGVSDEEEENIKRGVQLWQEMLEFEHGVPQDLDLPGAVNVSYLDIDSTSEIESQLRQGHDGNTYDALMVVAPNQDLRRQLLDVVPFLRLRTLFLNTDDDTSIFVNKRIYNDPLYRESYEERSVDFSVEDAVVQNVRAGLNQLDGRPVASNMDTSPIMQDWLGVTTPVYEIFLNGKRIANYVTSDIVADSPGGQALHKARELAVRLPRFNRVNQLGDDRGNLKAVIKDKKIILTTAQSETRADDPDPAQENFDKVKQLATHFVTRNPDLDEDRLEISSDSTKRSIVIRMRGKDGSEYSRAYNQAMRLDSYLRGKNLNFEYDYRSPNQPEPDPLFSLSLTFDEFDAKSETREFSVYHQEGQQYSANFLPGQIRLILEAYIEQRQKVGPNKNARALSDGKINLYTLERDPNSDYTANQEWIAYALYRDQQIEIVHPEIETKDYGAGNTPSLEELMQDFLSAKRERSVKYRILIRLSSDLENLSIELRDPDLLSDVGPQTLLGEITDPRDLSFAQIRSDVGRRVRNPAIGASATSFMDEMLGATDEHQAALAKLSDAELRDAGMTGPEIIELRRRYGQPDDQAQSETRTKITFDYQTGEAYRDWLEVQLGSVLNDGSDEGIVEQRLAQYGFRDQVFVAINQFLGHTTMNAWDALSIRDGLMAEDDYEPKITIRISVSEGKNVTLELEDNGIGMDADTLQKLYFVDEDEHHTTKLSPEIQALTNHVYGRKGDGAGETLGIVILNHFTKAMQDARITTQSKDRSGQAHEKVIVDMTSFDNPPVNEIEKEEQGTLIRVEYTVGDGLLPETPPENLDIILYEASWPPPIESSKQVSASSETRNPAVQAVQGTYDTLLSRYSDASGRVQERIGTKLRTQVLELLEIVKEDVKSSDLQRLFAASHQLRSVLRSRDERFWREAKGARTNISDLAKNLEKASVPSELLELIQGYQQHSTVDKSSRRDEFIALIADTYGIKFNSVVRKMQDYKEEHFEGLGWANPKEANSKWVQQKAQDGNLEVSLLQAIYAQDRHPTRWTPASYLRGKAQTVAAVINRHARLAVMDPVSQVPAAEIEIILPLLQQIIPALRQMEDVEFDGRLVVLEETELGGVIELRGPVENSRLYAQVEQLAEQLSEALENRSSNPVLTFDNGGSQFQFRVVLAIDVYKEILEGLGSIAQSETVSLRNVDDGGSTQAVLESVKIGIDALSVEALLGLAEGLREIDSDNEQIRALFQSGRLESADDGGSTDAFREALKSAADGLEIASLFKLAELVDAAKSETRAIGFNLANDDKYSSVNVSTVSGLVGFEFEFVPRDDTGQPEVVFVRSNPSMDFGNYLRIQQAMLELLAAKRPTTKSDVDAFIDELTFRGIGGAVGFRFSRDSAQSETRIEPSISADDVEEMVTGLVAAIGQYLVEEITPRSPRWAINQNDIGSASERRKVEQFVIEETLENPTVNGDDAIDYYVNRVIDRIAAQSETRAATPAAVSEVLTAPVVTVAETHRDLLAPERIRRESGEAVFRGVVHQLTGHLKPESGFNAVAFESLPENLQTFIQTQMPEHYKLMRSSTPTEEQGRIFHDIDLEIPGIDLVDEDGLDVPATLATTLVAASLGLQYTLLADVTTAERQTFLDDLDQLAGERKLPKSFKPSAYLNFQIEDGAKLAANYIHRNLTGNQVPTATVTSRRAVIDRFSAMKNLARVLIKDPKYLHDTASAVAVLLDELTKNALDLHDDESLRQNELAAKLIQEIALLQAFLSAA